VNGLATREGDSQDARLGNRKGQSPGKDEKCGYDGYFKFKLTAVKVGRELSIRAILPWPLMERK
jgi:hypothetical protein